MHMFALRTCISTHIRWCPSDVGGLLAQPWRPALRQQCCAHDLHLYTAGTSPASSISTWVNSRGILAESYAFPRSNPAGRRGCEEEVLDNPAQLAAARWACDPMNQSVNLCASDN